MKIKKILYSIILGIGSFIGLSLADCYIYGSDNELLMMFQCEIGTTTEITLEGNRTESISSEGNGVVYTFQDGFYGTTVYYIDSYGNNKSVVVEDDLYLNGNLSIGYTGQQYFILTDDSCGIFDGYKTTFDVTGTINPTDTGNIFNNFAENSLKFTLSNIPSYIQYVIIIMLLFLILGFIRKFKRK